MKRIDDKSLITRGHKSVLGTQGPALFGEDWNKLVDAVTRLQDKVDRQESEIRSLRRQLSNVRSDLF